MQYISAISFLLFIGCGGDKAMTVNGVEAPGSSGVDNSNDANNTADLTPSPSTTPSPTPTIDLPYTASYGNIFCNQTSSDLECFGDITFHTSTPVTALVIGADSVCISYSGIQIKNDPNHAQEIGYNANILNGLTDLECYTATLGPITMNANQLLHNDQNDLIQSISIDSTGNICIKTADYGDSGNTLQSISTPCGLIPNNNGGIGS